VAVDDKEEAFKTKLSFIRRFLENVLVGLEHDEARFFADNAVNCYFECLYFVITKRLNPYLEQSTGSPN
jgi:hypothetical protein